MTSASLRPLGTVVMLMRPGFASVTHFVRHTHPVHSMGSPSLPRPLITHCDLLRCRTFYLLAIAYDYDVLGLGPD